MMLSGNCGGVTIDMILYLPQLEAVRYWSCPLSQNRSRIIPRRPSMLKWAQHMKKLYQRWDSNPCTHDYRAAALPAKPRRPMIIIAQCHRFPECAEVALSASYSALSQLSRCDHWIKTAIMIMWSMVACACWLPKGAKIKKNEHHCQKWDWNQRLCCALITRSALPNTGDLADIKH